MPLVELALDGKSMRDLAALAKLGRTPATLRFDREDLDPGRGPRPG